MTNSHALRQPESGTAAGGAAGVAFEAGDVANQREVAAFLAAVALLALDREGTNALAARLADGAAARRAKPIASCLRLLPTQTV